MKFLGLILSVLLLFGIHLTANQPIPYSGKISIRGVNYDGDAQFTFSLQTKDGKTRWRNGNKKDDSIKVRVRNGFYNVLLGGQGMNSLPPQLFLDYDELYLKVRFDNGDGKGLRHLEPDQRITATPRALVAEVAEVAKVAKVAELVKDGVITRNMLHANVLSDLNQPTPVSGSIKLSMLDPEVTAKLDQNGSGGSGVIAGSLISVPYGKPAPAGYSLYQRGTPTELVWEEKAPVSVARYAYDGVEVLDGKIYFVGGSDGSARKIAERYDPETNSWEAIAPMSVARAGLAASVLNGKLYAAGGSSLSGVEVFDPSTGNWSTGPALPSEVRSGIAITIGAKTYLIGGINASNQKINQVLCFDPSTNQWSAKANMPTARSGHKLVWFENRIWAIGGGVDGNALRKVESYDPISDSWQNEASLISLRNVAVAWVANEKIYVGCGGNGSAKLNSIETYNPTNQQWSSAGNFPEVKYLADAVVLNHKVYVIAGQNDSGFSNKVFAADLNASVAGVYDLYRKDGNASTGTPLVQAEVVNGSVTSNKIATGAITASKIANNTITKAQLNDQILKYLKPEITVQPNVSSIFSDTNCTFSLFTEGKYLTYQWRKDNSDLVGETNSTITIIDANASQHDGNYSVVVTNDFGSVVSDIKPLNVLSSESDGLLAWYDFDGNSQDKSGNNRHGNPSGVSYVNGKIMQAVNFDGNNDRITLPSFPIGGSNTFALWLYFENADDWNAPFDFGDGAQSFNLRLSIGPFDSSSNTYPVVFDIRNSQYENIVSNYFFSNSSWVHLTVVLSDTFNLIYKSGKLVHKEIGITPITKSRTKQWIGKSNWNADNYTGLIDDFRIYDRALSSAEVQALYNLGQ